MAGIPGSQTGAGETVVGGGNLGAELSYQGDSSCGGWDKQATSRSLGQDAICTDKVRSLGK